MKSLSKPVELPVLDHGFKADPYPFYEGLRHSQNGLAPVRFPSGVKAWLVLDHDLARRLLHEPTLSKEPSRRDAVSPGSRLPPSEMGLLSRHLLTLDPPDHSRLRGIVANEFSPRQIQRLRPGIEELVHKSLDEMQYSAEFDIMACFARPLPLRIVCGLLGVAPESESRISDWTERLLSADLEDSQDMEAVSREFHQFLVELAREKQTAPDGSVYSSLVAARDRGELTANELTGMGFLLLAAGFETTMNLIGNGLIVLLSEPGRWRALGSGMHGVVDVVEELLRFCGPLESSTARLATEDLDIGGTTIHAGDLVFVSLAAANRDPAAFEDPHRFCPGREGGASHLAFGLGSHYCLGASLARMTAELAFGGLAARFPGMELNLPPEGPEWIPGLIMRGVRRLPVRVHPVASGHLSFDK